MNKVELLEFLKCCKIHCTESASFTHFRNLPIATLKQLRGNNLNENNDIKFVPNDFVGSEIYLSQSLTFIIALYISYLQYNKMS